MSPKEKAEHIFERYYSIKNSEGVFILTKFEARICAIICVEEIEKAIDFYWMEVQNLDSEHRYWQEVKQELEKL